MPPGQTPGIEQLLQLVMQILTTPPDVPAGEVPSGLPPSGVPGAARNPSEEEQVMSLLMSLLQTTGMGQSGQQMMNGAQGGAGAPFGAMGGRPVGS